MTTKKAAPALLAAAALCWCTSVLHAEEPKVFVMGGVSSFKDARAFYQNTVPYGSEYSTSGRVTAGIEMPIHKMFGIEGAFAYGQNNLVISNYAANPIAKTSYGIRNARFSWNLVGHSPVTFRGWRPYVTAGMELNSFMVSDKAAATAVAQGFAGAATARLQSQDKLGVNFGGGMEWKATSRISLRLDMRGHMFSSPNYALPAASSSISNAIFPISGGARNLEYSMGIVYYLRK